ncbi:MAG: MBL fold metallo-hydrolase [Desulfovibrio sp.]|nr:MBL fold metallo-hydrolase [Desulfovibrio sp.]
MPKFTLPVNKLTHTSFPEIPSKFAACWLGHSTLIIELDGKRLLVDPVFGNAAPVPGIVRRYEESPLKREDLPCIDYVLITHDHYDHLEYPTIKFLREKRETHFIVPLGVDSHLLEWGIPPARIHPLGWGKTYTGGLDVTSEPTVHFSGRTFGSRNSTLWTSYVIRGKSQRIYISGDTGYGPHFSESGEKHGPFDAAFIEIDGWNPGWPKTHLFPKEVIKACRQLKAQALIPVHWGVFDLALHPWDESITILADLAAQTENINLQTPLLGEIFVPGETSTRKWWL